MLPKKDVKVLSKTISLCMIVKDEEKFLEQCINSVRKYVDEIIVVDTGSKDRTIQIAESLGAKVYNFAWVNDFSEARNFSISKAASDWILVLDADEFLVEKDIIKLRKMVKSTAVSAFQLVQRTYTNNSEAASWRQVLPDCAESRGFLGYFDVYVARLFKNNCNFRFTGRVHEDMTQSAKEMRKPMLRSDIVIHHYEYSRGTDFVREKQLYYLDLTLKKIKEQPDNPKAYGDAGIGYLFYKNDADKAMHYFKMALEVDAAYKTAYNYIAKILVQKNRMDEAISFLKKAVDLGICDETAYANMGKLLSAKGRLNDALPYLEKAVEMNPSNFFAVYNLAELHAGLSNHSKAIACFEQALNLRRACKMEHIYEKLAELYELTSNFNKSLRYYNLLAGPASQEKERFIEKIYAIKKKLYK